MTTRHRFYREHKLIIALVNDVTRLIAKTNFCKDDQIQILKKQLTSLTSLLKAHAEHEENAFHVLLEAKGSIVHQEISDDHEKHLVLFSNWDFALNSILAIDDPETRVEQGYQFYLTFREFDANNLHHLNIEETVIMSELQRLYSDAELEAVEAKTYKKNEMTPDAIIEMMKVLFPYMELHDYQAFLSEIYNCVPDKFDTAFNGIINATTDAGKPILDPKEICQLVSFFS